MTTTGLSALAGRARVSRDQRLFVAILLISLLAVVAGFIAIRQAEERLLADEAGATAIHWANFLDRNLSDLDEILQSGLVSREDQRLFEFASQAGRVYRFEVVRPDGVTALSSWAGDLRKTSSNPNLVQALATGKPSVALVEEQSFDNSVLVHGEAYVPILRNDTVAGLIRVNVDMTARAAGLRQTGNAALLALVALLVVIGGLSGAVVWHNIRDRNRELREILESRARIADAEKTIRALNRRNEMILNSAGEGIYGLDRAGRVTFINPAGAQILGRDAGAVIGEPQGAIAAPGGLYEVDPREPERDPILAAIELGIEQRGSDVTFWRYDGTGFPVEFTSTPTFDEDGVVTGAVVVFSDITERKRAERALARQAEDLARSNAELEQFAYVASHDLQEPLRKIQAFGDRLMVKFGDGLGDDGRQYLTRMQNAAGRMRDLIDALLSFSRIGTDAQTFEPVNLKLLAHEVVADLDLRIQDLGATVEVEDLPTIDANPVQLRQLLQNLIANALKFQRPGVPPRVRVAAEWPQPDATAQQTAGAQPACCQILVQDNGIGFDEKYLDRVFAVFQRLHGRNEYEGTGIGLAICRKIAERHHGSITAHSTPGQGSTFIITLPVRQTKEKIAA